MTAVESQAPLDPFLTSSSESPSAQFTAVNGTTNGNGHLRKISDDRPLQARVTSSSQERPTASANSQKEDWPVPVNADRPSQVSQPATQAEPESLHKRKRSRSGEELAASMGTFHNHNLPAPGGPYEPSGMGRHSPDAPYPDSLRQSNTRVLPPISRDPYAVGQPSYPQYGGDTREGNSSPWYGQQSREARPVVDNQAGSNPHHMSTEDQLREALQRESQGSDMQSPYARNSPGDEDDHSGAPYSGPYGSDRNSLIQSDPKKRKRNFSNRTKTGCMTCRRRKKKCDETRPECNNCIRGGFVCNGYPSRGQWPKTEHKQAPVPLQSKEGYDGAYAQSAYNPHGGPGQSKREPLPGYRGQPLRVDAQQLPPRQSIEDDRQNASTMGSSSINSPDHRLPAVPYSQSGPFPTPISANPNSYPDRNSQNDYKRMPHLMEPSRQEHDGRGPQSATSSLPHISMLHPSHSNSPHPHTPQSVAAQDAARLALSHPASGGRQRSQKEDMLQGKPYFPYDRELVHERERCLAACWRFNNSTNPNNGVSPENRAGLFRDILKRKDSISPTLATPISPAGDVGNNVVVEAPFNCDYGYNIHIGQEVAIGKNCTIMDTCEVKIGDRCVIGPNVNIFTAMLPVDPKKRLGSLGPQLGKPIVIEEDCWIGGGVTILPGRTIKRGSTVGAGSVITRDVPAYTVVCGNPAHVMRGIYE